MLDRLNFLLEFGEEFLRQPINLHLSSGLVGQKAFYTGDGLQAEILLSITELKDQAELERCFFRALAALHLGPELSRNAAQLDLTATSLAELAAEKRKTWVREPV